MFVITDMHMHYIQKLNKLINLQCTACVLAIMHVYCWRLTLLLSSLYAYKVTEHLKSTETEHLGNSAISTRARSDIPIHAQTHIDLQ